jgi:hypothetical protein
MTGHTTFKDRALRAVAILGLIAILLLGAWGIIQIAFTLYGFLGTSTPEPTTSAVTTQAPAPTEQVIVTSPATITSGVPFTLSFVHQNAAAGTNYSYEISYSCASGVSLKAPLPTGSMQSVACNTPFNYTNATSNVQLTATLTASTQAPVTFIVAAKNLATGAVTSSGAAASTLFPPTAATATTPPATPIKTTSTPGSTYVAAARTTSLYGLPDLSVSMGNVGDIGGRYTVQFTIQNVGTNVTPAGWTFNASLPTNPTYTYTSTPQQALYPGDKIVYTLGFTMNNNSYGTNTSYSNYPYGNSNSGYNQNCGYSTNYTYNGTYSYPNVVYGCNTGSTYNSYVPAYPSSYSNTYNYAYPTYSYPSSYVMTVTADPSGYVYESNKANNSASVTLSNY